MQKLDRIHLLTAGRRLGAWLAFLLCLLLLTSSGWSAEKAKPEAPPPAKTEDPAPQPEKILQQACDLLKSAQQFSFKAEVTDDRVYTEGKKLQFAFDLEAYVQRPDKVRINAAGDLENPASIDRRRIHAEENGGPGELVGMGFRVNVRGIEDVVIRGHGTIRRAAS